MRCEIMLVLTSLICGSSALAQSLPDRSFAPDTLFQVVSPQLSATQHNQPSALNGYLVLAGNATHEVWDISDPFNPAQVTTFTSPHNMGEAESHTVSYARRGDTYFAVTISGRGIDLWNVTDLTAPVLLNAMELESINYGDVTNAVWGVFWQGDYIYVGGTNTGLHIVDASDPSSPSLVRRMPTTEFGGISAGPVWAVGNLLVIATPKDTSGLATMDISDPANPTLLDFVAMTGSDSYMGAFFGGHAYLQTPLRTYDVTTDPSNIELLGMFDTPKSEYISFGDSIMFLGLLRPMPGALKLDVSDPNNVVTLGTIPGRTIPGIDDQFTFPIGNLLVLSDDQVNAGSVLTVHDTMRDSIAPEVLYVNPPDGSTNQALTTRVAVSFSDQIDLSSVDITSIVIRPLDGAPLAGMWGFMQTLVTFWPDDPLTVDTTYEIVLPAGGVRDLVGNPTSREFRSEFSTGAIIDSAQCTILPTIPAEVGTDATLEAMPSGASATFTWDFGDGAMSAPGPASVAHNYAEPGRYAVQLTVNVGTTQRSCASTLIVHRPTTSGAPTRSSTIVLDETAGRAFTVNPDADSVAAIDMTSLERVYEADVGDDPRTLALAPDGTLWVVNRESDDVHIVESATGSPVATIALRYGSMPYGIAFSPDGASAFVTLEQTGSLVRIDTASRAVAETLELGPDAVGLVPRVRGIAIDEAAQRAYVTRFVSPEDRGEVFVVDITTSPMTLSNTIALAHDPGPDDDEGGRGVPNYLSSITISPDGRFAWVPSSKFNTQRGMLRDGLMLTQDNTVRTIVSAIDLGTQIETLPLRVDIDDQDMAFAAEFSALGDVLFVVSQGSNRVDVLDAYDGERIAGFATGLAPRGLALASDGRLFVSNFLSRSVAVLDMSGVLDGTDLTAPRVGDVSSVAEEPLAPDVLLGKQIFYNADDPRMSLEGYMSCATCHQDGEHDGRIWDFTQRGEGLRNTIPMRGRGGMNHGPVHWTGNFDEIQDFENDIRAGLGGSGFMNEDAFHMGTRSDPLGDAKAQFSPALDALAAFVASLDSFGRSPFRNQDGTMTPEAVLGADVFASAGCAECHGGAAYTDSALGVFHDVGTITPSSGTRRSEPLTGFDTPTLLGLWASAPYLHDGSAATLEAVLANPEHGNGSSLNVEDRARLIAYLLQIEGEPGTVAPAGCGCRVGARGNRSGLWLLVGCVALGVARRRRRPAS